MKLKDALREWLGDQWGKMLVLLVMLAVLPVSTLAIGEYGFTAILFLVLLGPFLAYVLLRHYLGIAVVRKLLDKVGGLVGALFILCLVIAGVYSAFQNWYPHTSPTLVYTNGNWMDGEKRDCFLDAKAPQYSLDCTVKPAEAEPHRFDVTYTGADPADQKDKPQGWTGTRMAGSISCKKER